MDTAYDLYAVLRQQTISFPFSLSMLSWTFAQLRENKETDPCHYKRQRTGKAEENGSKSRSQTENSHFSSRSCHLGTAFQAPQRGTLGVSAFSVSHLIALVCCKEDRRHVLRGCSLCDRQLENHSSQSSSASDVLYKQSSPSVYPSASKHEGQPLTPLPCVRSLFRVHPSLSSSTFTVGWAPGQPWQQTPEHLWHFLIKGHTAKGHWELEIRPSTGSTSDSPTARLERQMSAEMWISQTLYKVGGTPSPGRWI